MAFTEHKITDFAHRLSDLPDQPNLSAAELKAYFDSSPEELRQALNGVCTDAERLDDRVSGIVTETFGDAIPKTMLSTELQSEIDAKAEESAVAARLEAEQAERAAADKTQAEQVDTLQAQKCEAYFGSYMGDGAADRIIDLGFRPIAAIILCDDKFFALKTQTYTCVQATDVTVTSNATTESGLHVGTTEHDSRYSSYSTNSANRRYEYVAFKGIA